MHKGVKKPEPQGSSLLEPCPVAVGIFAPREGGGQPRPPRFSGGSLCSPPGAFLTFNNRNFHCRCTYSVWDHSPQFTDEEPGCGEGKPPTWGQSLGRVRARFCASGSQFQSSRFYCRGLWLGVRKRGLGSPAGLRVSQALTPLGETRWAALQWRGDCDFSDRTLTERWVVAQLGPRRRATGPGTLLQAYGSGRGLPRRGRMESRRWVTTDLGTNSDSVAA